MRNRTGICMREIPIWRLQNCAGLLVSFFITLGANSWQDKKQPACLAVAALFRTTLVNVSGLFCFTVSGFSVLLSSEFVFHCFRTQFYIRLEWDAMIYLTRNPLHIKRRKYKHKKLHSVHWTVNNLDDFGAYRVGDFALYFVRIFPSVTIPPVTSFLQQ